METDDNSSDKLVDEVIVDVFKRKAEILDTFDSLKNGVKKLCGNNGNSLNLTIEDSENVQDIAETVEYSQIWRITIADEGFSFSNVPFHLAKDYLDQEAKKWSFLTFTDSLKGFLFRLGNSQAVQILMEWKVIILPDGSEVDITLRKQGDEYEVRKGIIIDTFCAPYEIEYLEELLKNQGVIKVEKIQKTNRLGMKYYTGSIVCTFDRKVPEYVEILTVNLRVQEYLPRPRLCGKCGSLNHIARNCIVVDELCKRCFTIHDKESVCNIICKNCGDSHFTYDISCPKIIQQTEILKIRDGLQINYRDAVTYMNNNGMLKKIDEILEVSKKDKIIMKQEKELLNSKNKVDKMAIRVNQLTLEKSKYITVINTLKSTCNAAVEGRKAAEAESSALGCQLAEISTGVEKIEIEQAESKTQIISLKEKIKNTQLKCAESEQKSKDLQKVDELNKVKIVNLEYNLKFMADSFGEFINFSDNSKHEYKKYLRSLDKKKIARLENYVHLKPKE